MTADLYDLAARLRAAHEHRPVHRATHTSALPPFHPVAITTTRQGRHITLTATSDGLHAHGTDADALAALAAVCVDLTEAHRTLVIATRADLAALDEVANKYGRQGPHERVAAVIGWWVQRADHPGSGAVLTLVEALRARYTLGTARSAERTIAAWRTALQVDDDTTAGLLALAQHATQGTPLAGLDEARDTDHRSWNFYRDRILNGRPWNSRDSRREAALGLATRCHAAELHNSHRLRDPLMAAREAFTGNVVTGTTTAVTKDTLTLTAHRPVSRLRTDSDVTGWAGTPLDADTATTRLTRGHLQAATISGTGALTLTITGTTTRPTALAVGDLLTLIARPADPQQQGNGRRNMAQRYAHKSNWIATGKAPAPRRRDVPLDVVIAAAE